MTNQADQQFQVQEPQQLDPCHSRWEIPPSRSYYNRSLSSCDAWVVAKKKHGENGIILGMGKDNALGQCQLTQVEEAEIML